MFNYVAGIRKSCFNSINFNSYSNTLKHWSKKTAISRLSAPHKASRARSTDLKETNSKWPSHQAMRSSKLGSYGRKECTNLFQCSDFVFKFLKIHWPAFALASELLQLLFSCFSSHLPCLGWVRNWTEKNAWEFVDDYDDLGIFWHRVSPRHFCGTLFHPRLLLLVQKLRRPWTIRQRDWKRTPTRWRAKQLSFQSDEGSAGVCLEWNTLHRGEMPLRFHQVLFSIRIRTTMSDMLRHWKIKSLDCKDQRGTSWY